MLVESLPSTDTIITTTEETSQVLQDLDAAVPNYYDLDSLQLLVIGSDVEKQSETVTLDSSLVVHTTVPTSIIGSGVANQPETVTLDSSLVVQATVPTSISAPQPPEHEPGPSGQAPGSQCPQKRTRECKSDPQEWTRSIRKKQCQTGRTYVSSRGKNVQAKSIQTNPWKKCKFKCKENFTKERRQDIHQAYWLTEPKERKYDFICHYVEESEPDKKRKERK